MAGQGIVLRMKTQRDFVVVQFFGYESEFVADASGGDQKQQYDQTKNRYRENNLFFCITKYLSKLY